MKTITVSSKGKVAIPQDMRVSLNISAGDTLYVSLEDGKLVLEPTVSDTHSQTWFWTEELQERIKKAGVNFEAGNFNRYTIEEFLEALEKRASAE
jgi:AbrB family looped-hinge helix DNA binding protein